MVKMIAERQPFRNKTTAKQSYLMSDATLCQISANAQSGKFPECFKDQIK